MRMTQRGQWVSGDGYSGPRQKNMPRVTLKCIKADERVGNLKKGSFSERDFRVVEEKLASPREIP
jgi:hypothetical protein